MVAGAFPIIEGNDMSDHNPEPPAAPQSHRLLLVMSLLTVVAVVAAVALTLALTGRDSSPTPTPIAATTTMTTKTTPSGICIAAVGAGIVVNEWGLVMASIGEVDHEERLKSFIEFVKDDQDDARTDDGCAADYTVEIAELAYEASLLHVLVIAGNAQSADYENVANAGQAWVDKIGRSDLLFSGSSR